MLLELTIGIFLLAAAGGLIMATQIFKGRKPTVAIALLHGPLAGVGLFMVFWLWMESQAATVLSVALGVLVLAALGGFFLVSFHMRGKPHPKPVVVVHALAAVTGVGALIVAALA